MYNPNIHHRHSIRLPNYDYSQEGLYFVTTCVQNREYLFGGIQDGEMMLNDAGKMVEKWYHEIPNKFPDIELGEYIVMPNHFHAIIVNTGVGAHLCVRPDEQPTHPDGQSAHLGEMGQVLNIIGQTRRSAPTAGKQAILGEHVGSPLHAVVQWFKTMSTNEYIRGVKMLGWESFEKKLWQRNYYEHIIRSAKSLQHISDYILCNPNNWEDDELYNRTNQ